MLRLNQKLQRHPKCPFKRALHVNKARAVVVEGAELPTNFFIVKKGDRLNPQEKVSVITSPFLNSSCANTRFRFAKGTPIHKKSFPVNKYTSVPSGRQTKVVSKVLGKINQRPKHIGHYSRININITFIYFHLPIGPFHCAKIKAGFRVMRMHYFWIQNCPFAPNNNF